MQFEDILDKVDGYGKYQKILTIFFLIPVFCALPCFWVNFFFMVSVPEHWCYVAELSHLNISQQRMLISPVEDPSCTMYNVNYSLVLDAESFITSNSSNITTCASGWQYDKSNFDSTVSTKFDLVCDRNHYPSLLFTLQNVGSLFGTPIYGYLADKFGRKHLFFIMTAIGCVTDLASLLADNFIIFAVMRIVNGSIHPSMFIFAFVLIIEFVSPDMRAHINGFANCSWTIGLCFLPLIAYLARSWVILCAYSVVGGFCLLFYWCFIPESPCWYVSREKYDEALKIMLKIGKTNGRPQDPGQMMLHLKHLGEKIRKTKEEEKKDTKSPFLKYPRLRRNFLILTVNWIAFNVAYTGLTYNLINLNGNIFLNFFLLCVVEMPGNFLFWFLMDTYGRRWSATFGFTLTGLICLVPLTGFKYSDIITSMMGKLLISGVFMITDQQGSELFPTVFRSFAIGTSKTIVKAVVLFVPYIAELGKYGKNLPFLLVSLTCLISGFLASFLPETFNENLPQTITDAEAFGKNQKFLSWNRKEKRQPNTEVTLELL